MWRFRILLLPFAAVAELTLLVACWCIALVSPATASRIMQANRVFPGVYWYLEK